MPWHLLFVLFRLNLRKNFKTRFLQNTANEPRACVWEALVKEIHKMRVQSNYYTHSFPSYFTHNSSNGFVEIGTDSWKEFRVFFACALIFHNIGFNKAVHYRWHVYFSVFSCKTFKIHPRCAFWCTISTHSCKWAKCAWARKWDYATLCRFFDYSTLWYNIL